MNTIEKTLDLFGYLLQFIVAMTITTMIAGLFSCGSMIAFTGLMLVGTCFSVWFVISEYKSLKIY